MVAAAALGRPMDSITIDDVVEDVHLPDGEIGWVLLLLGGDPKRWIKQNYYYEQSVNKNGLI